MEHSEQAPAAPLPLLKKRSIRWTLGILGVGGLILALLPQGIGYGLKKGLMDQGAESVRVENVDFNLFTGALAIEGLETTRNGAPKLSLGQFKINISWLALFQQRILVEELKVAALIVEAEQFPSGAVQAAGIDIPPPPESAKEEAPPPAPEEKSAWGIGVQKLEIDSLQVTARAPQVEAVLSAAAWRLSDLASWTPDQAAPFSLRGAVNEAPYALEGALKPFADAPEAVAAISIDGLDFSRFATLAADAGVAELAGLLSTDLKITARKDPEGASLTQEGSIDLTGVGLKQEAVALSGAALSWRGSLEVTQRADSVGVTQNGKINLTVERLAQAETTLKDAALSWDGALELKSEPAAGEASLKQTALVTADLGKLSRPDLRVGKTGIVWDGDVAAAFGPEAPPALDVKGTLSGRPLSLSLPQQDLAVAYHGLSWQGDLGLGSLDLEKNFVTAGTFRLDGLRARAAKPKIALLELGRLQVDGIRVRGLNDIRIKRVGLKGLDLARQIIKGKERKKPLFHGSETRVESIRLTQMKNLAIGAITQGPGSAKVTRNADGGLEVIDDILAHFGIKTAPPKKQTAKKGKEPEPAASTPAAAPATEQVVTGEKGFTVRLASFKERRRAERSRRGLTALTEDAIAIRSLTNSKGVTWHAVEAGFFPAKTEAKTALAQWKERGEKGAILAKVRRLTTVAATAEGKTAPARSAPAEPPPPIKLGSLVVQDGIAVRFIDRSVSPPFDSTFVIKEVRLSQVDSAQPDQESPFRFVGKLNKYSLITLKGSAKPFAPRPTIDLTGKIQELDLPPVSPYVAGVIGYNLASGNLEVDVDMDIVQGKMTGLTKLRVNNLEVAAAADDGVSKLATNISIPLDTALSLLRDGNGDIVLEVPIAGDVDNPDFDVSDAINQALGGALQKGAVTFLKVALQPFGTLLTAAELASDLISAIPLESMEMAPGTVDPGDDATPYAAKLAGMLAERKGLRLKLCGIAVEADRDILFERKKATIEKERAAAAKKRKKSAKKGKKEAAPPPPPIPPVEDAAVLKLAKARSMALKDLLIKEHAIASKRLFICNPALDKSDGAKPRVEPKI